MPERAKLPSLIADSGLYIHVKANVARAPNLATQRHTDSSSVSAVPLWSDRELSALDRLAEWLVEWLAGSLICVPHW